MMVVNVENGYGVLIRSRCSELCLVQLGVGHRPTGYKK